MLQRWPKWIDDSSGNLVAIIASFEAKSVRITAWDESKGRSLAVGQLKNQNIGVEALLTCEYDQTVVNSFEVCAPHSISHCLAITQVAAFGK